MKKMIECPTCKTKFNVTKQINEFKEEVIKASKILDKIKEIKWQD